VFRAYRGTNPAQLPDLMTTVRPDQSNVSGLPGNKSGPALQPSTGLHNQAQGAEEEEDRDRFFRHHEGMMGMMGLMDITECLKAGAQ
jgi:hypothetical protein